MNQFKDVFTGPAETRSYKRATSSQKCVRAGGKHNDLEDMGKTPRHHRFFEMLGNFSLRRLLQARRDCVRVGAPDQKVYGIDANRLVVTVYGGDPELPGIAADDEARTLWKKVTGFGDDRIIGLGKKDNFLAVGDTGPMGPVHRDPLFPTSIADPATSGRPRPARGWKGWLEILEPRVHAVRSPAPRERRPAARSSPAPSVDTGAGSSA